MGGNGVKEKITIMEGKISKHGRINKHIYWKINVGHGQRINRQKENIWRGNIFL